MTEEVLVKHNKCATCYFKNNTQFANLINECTTCLFNVYLPKTNNYKPLPTVKELA